MTRNHFSDFSFKQKLSKESDTESIDEGLQLARIPIFIFRTLRRLITETDGISKLSSSSTPSKSKNPWDLMKKNILSVEEDGKLANKFVAFLFKEIEEKIFRFSLKN